MLTQSVHTVLACLLVFAVGIGATYLILTTNDRANAETEDTVELYSSQTEL